MAGAEASWRARAVESEAKDAVSKYEAALNAEAGHPEGWVKLSRALLFLGEAHMRARPEYRSHRAVIHQRGVQAAERALKLLNATLAERMSHGGRFIDAINLVERSDVAALFFREANVDAWADASGGSTSAEVRDEVRLAMQRCLELDSAFHYGAPHRYFGTWFARTPSYAGGDLTRSRDHFEAAIQIAPGVLSTRVAFAEDYATKTQDRELFDEQLQAVINADANGEAELAPENASAQARARDLLGRADALFD